MTTTKFAKKQRRNNRAVKNKINAVSSLTSEWNRISTTTSVLTEEEHNAKGRVSMELVNHGGGLSDMSIERMREIENVTKFLLEDISKEPIITKLITERGILTLEGIKAAMAEAEQYTKPLWEGSL